MPRITLHPPSIAMVLLLMALPGACTASEANMHSIQADLGGTAISLGIPDGLVAMPIPGGVTIRRPDAEQSRRIHEMTVTLAGGAPPVALDQTRGSGADAIRYGVTRSEGGSGGEDVTLIADRRCGDATVRLRLATQADEDGKVDLDPALAILASARCEAGGPEARK